MKVRKMIKKGIAALFLVGSAAMTFAQPPGGPPPGGGGTQGTDPPCWDPECIPVDGGIWFLLLGGTLLGIRMIYAQRNRSRA